MEVPTDPDLAAGAPAAPAAADAPAPAVRAAATHASRYHCAIFKGAFAVPEVRDYHTAEDLIADLRALFAEAAGDQTKAALRAVPFVGDRLRIAGDPHRKLYFPDGSEVALDPHGAASEPDDHSGFLLPPSKR